MSDQFNTRDLHDPSQPPRRPRRDQRSEQTERQTSPSDRFLQRPQTSNTSEVRPTVQNNPFGTREDVEQEDYQSPISQMMGRAWDRYRTAEEQRQVQAQNLAIAADLARPSAPHSWSSRETAYLESTFRRSQLTPFRSFGREPGATTEDDDDEEEEVPNPTPGPNRIDTQSRRPQVPSSTRVPPGMTCYVCMEQQREVMAEPCMHVIACRWCFEIWQDEVAQIRRANPSSNTVLRCMLCRTPVRNTRRV